MEQYPLVRATIGNRYMVEEDFKPVNSYQDILVPKNYLTNGADVPRIFWFLIPPFKPKYLAAVIVHDYLCDLDYYRLADDVFEEMLYRVEKSFKTRTMIFCVRLYHRYKYGIK
jgi:hypothetical protein